MSMQGASAAQTDGIASAIASLDMEAAARTYWEQGELLVLDRFIGGVTLDAMIAEAGALRGKINRNYVPGQKKGGSVSSFDVAASAPVTSALYKSSEFIGLLNRLTREQLLLCPDGDPHRSALYYYTEAGDHIGYHFDTSFYKGKRYTVLIGLVERSSSRLVCQLYKNDPSRETRELSVETSPGTVVIFNGDKLWHCVTPLGQGEERVVLTLQYVTDQRMGPLQRVVSDVKDAVAYFGIRSLFRRRR
jgi:hypothetical protein